MNKIYRAGISRNHEICNQKLVNRQGFNNNYLFYAFV